MHEDVRRLLRWLIAFVLTATVLWTGVLGIQTLYLDGGAAFIGSLPLALTAAVAGLVWSLLACGFYGPTLAFWPRAAKKWPVIETSWLGLFATTGVLALPPAIGAAALSGEFLLWLIPVGVMCWGGLFLPRIIVRGLRLGVFSEGSRLTSA